MQILLPLLQLKKEQRKRLGGILKLLKAHMPGISLALDHFLGISNLPFQVNFNGKYIYLHCNVFNQLHGGY